MELQNTKLIYENSVCIDWVRFSCALNSFDAVASLLSISRIASDWWEDSRYNKKWSTSFCDGCGVFADFVPEDLHTKLVTDISQDGEIKLLPVVEETSQINAGGGRFLVDFSGSGLGNFYEVFGYSAYQLLTLFCQLGEQYDIKCIRLDLAYDDHEKILNIRHMAKSVAVGKVNTRWLSYEFVGSGKVGESSLSEPSTGETLYIGSRQSDCFCRVYDKLAELVAHNKLPQELPDFWVRFELQFGGRQSDAVCQELVKAGESRAALVSCQILRGRIDFCKNSDGRASRRPVAKWWLNFCQTMERSIIRISRPARTFSRIESWVARSVAPSLAVLNQYYSGDYWLLPHLDDANGRITPELLKLLRLHEKHSYKDVLSALFGNATPTAQVSYKVIHSTFDHSS